MTSIRARLVNLALPLLGVKRFFAQREKLPERIAKLRQAEVELSRGLRTPAMCKKLGISEQTY